MAEEIIQKQMTLLPEYQEKFLKDLLANIYQTDEETGRDHRDRGPFSVVFGQPVYQAGRWRYDNSIRRLLHWTRLDPRFNTTRLLKGEFTTDPTLGGDRSVRSAYLCYRGWRSCP